MRTLTMVFLAGAMLLAAGACSAPALAPHHIGSHYNMPLEDFQIIKGQYELETGETLTLSNVQHRFFAELSGYGRTEIVPLDDNLFVSPDNTMRLELDRFPARVRLTLTPAR